MLRWIHIIGWLVCVVYCTSLAFWLTIHTQIDYWRSRGKLPYSIIVPGWMLMGVVMALVRLRWRGDDSEGR